MRWSVEITSYVFVLNAYYSSITALNGEFLIYVSTKQLFNGVCVSECVVNDVLETFRSFVEAQSSRRLRLALLP